MVGGDPDGAEIRRPTGLGGLPSDVEHYCHAVIVIGGNFVPSSEWIGYEIEHALEYGKPLIVVRQRYQRYVPEALFRSADAVVEW